MDRDEQVRAEAASDTIAFLKHEETVGVAGQRHPDPAGCGQRVTRGAGQRQGQVLFALPAGTDGARIMAAMAGINDDERQRPVIGAKDARQFDAVLQLADGYAHLIAALRPLCHGERGHAGQRRGNHPAARTDERGKIRRRAGTQQERERAAIGAEAGVADIGGLTEVKDEPQPPFAERALANPRDRPAAAVQMARRAGARDIEREPLGPVERKAARFAHRRGKIDADVLGGDHHAADRRRRRRRQAETGHQDQEQFDHPRLMARTPPSGPAVRAHNVFGSAFGHGLAPSPARLR